MIVNHEYQFIFLKTRKTAGDRSQYRDVMDEESRRIVEEVCSREIALLDYTF